MAFNVFVLDYGMMWIGRRQAQNAADAGALAGARRARLRRLRRSAGVRRHRGRSASGVAAANLVWQQAGTPVVTFNCPAGVTGRCVKVEVYRDGTNGSAALPTLFGPILGITTQKVRASATSIIGNGNATDCLRPIAFADDWQELRSPSDEFNSFDAAGIPLTGNRDSYTAPSATQVGRTIALPPPAGDFGERLIWVLDQPTTSSATPITRHLLVGVDLPGAGTYQQNGELQRATWFSSARRFRC